MSDRTTGTVLALLAVALLVATAGGSTLARLSDAERVDARLSGDGEPPTIGLRSPTPTAGEDATEPPEAEPTPTERPVVRVPASPTGRAVPSPPSTDRPDSVRSPTATEPSTRVVRSPRTPPPTPTPTPGREERGDA